MSSWCRLFCTPRYSSDAAGFGFGFYAVMHCLVLCVCYVVGFLGTTFRFVLYTRRCHRGEGIAVVDNEEPWRARFCLEDFCFFFSSCGEIFRVRQEGDELLGEMLLWVSRVSVKT